MTNRRPPDRNPQRRPPDRRPSRARGQGTLDWLVRSFDHLGSGEVDLGLFELQVDRLLMALTGLSVGLFVADVMSLGATLLTLPLGGQLGADCCCCCKLIFPLIGAVGGIILTPQMQSLRIGGWRVGAGGFVVVLLVLSILLGPIGNGIAQAAQFVREGTPVQQARDECRWVWEHNAPEDGGIPIPPQCDKFIPEFEAEEDGERARAPVKVNPKLAVMQFLNWPALLMGLAFRIGLLVLALTVGIAVFGGRRRRNANSS